MGSKFIIVFQDGHNGQITVEEYNSASEAGERFDELERETCIFIRYAECWGMYGKVE